MKARLWNVAWAADDWCHRHLPRGLNYRGPHRWLCDRIDSSLWSEEAA